METSPLCCPWSTIASWPLLRLSLRRSVLLIFGIFMLLCKSRTKCYKLEFLLGDHSNVWEFETGIRDKIKMQITLKKNEIDTRNLVCKRTISPKRWFAQDKLHLCFTVTLLGNHLFMTSFQSQLLILFPILYIY